MDQHAERNLATMNNQGQSEQIQPSHPRRDRDAERRNIPIDADRETQELIEKYYFWN